MAVARKIKASLTKSSMIRRMFEEGIILKKKHGADKVYDFSLGNPNIEPPEEFKKELINILEEIIPLKHGYTPNAGLVETREAIADKINKVQGMKLSADNVIMSCGAAGALNVIFKSLLDPGDEVILPVPYFVEYPFYIDNYRGIVKFVKTNEDFALNIESIEEAINENTKVVLINTPNNPTGKVYCKKHCWAGLLNRRSSELFKSIYLVADEPYNEIVYDNLVDPGILKSYKNAISACSYSKTLSLPGERIGYIAFNPETDHGADLQNAFVMCTRILGYVHAPVLMQRVIARLQGVKINVSVYQKNVICFAMVCKGRIQFQKPEGAFYPFCATNPNARCGIRQNSSEKISWLSGATCFGGPGTSVSRYCSG